MHDNSAKLAEFLIEHTREIDEEEIPRLLRDIFPDMTVAQSHRGFAIAREILATDIEEAARTSQSESRKTMLLAQYSMLKDYRPR